jgi:hypothetical protein
MNRLLTLATSGLFASGLAILPVSVFAQTASAPAGTDTKPVAAAPAKVATQDTKTAPAKPADTKVTATPATGTTAPAAKTANHS